MGSAGASLVNASSLPDNIPDGVLSLVPRVDCSGSAFPLLSTNVCTIICENRLLKNVMQNAILKVCLSFLFLAAGLLITLEVTGEQSGIDSWHLVFSENGASTWESNWFLEGEKATVENTGEGFVFTAGPVPLEQASHAVLWTRQDFSGDLKIQYDYTRLDGNLEVIGVNILFIHATGLGTEEHPEDIFLSTLARTVPRMKYYFLYMNSLHISYATERRYVSARRYPSPDVKSFQDGTQIQPIYTDIDLFQPGETWQITVIKEGGHLQFIAEREEERHVFNWNTTSFPDVSHGRIGLRHMWTRSSRYENFQVFEKKVRE